MTGVQTCALPICNITEKELVLLQNNLAALDRAQSTKAFKKALQDIVDYTDGAKDRLRGAYNVKHGGKQDAPGVPQGVDPKVWAVMTPEEKKLWQQ